MRIQDYPTDRGRYLIEASAGTGKTWTITHLFLRLVLQGIPVSRILVTTFSKAAAAELKERIVRVLDEELRNPDPSDGQDPLRKELLLRLAVSSIDEMTIGTLHSFCQKMLRDHALASRSDFDQVLIPNENQYRDRLVRAFFREKFYRSETGPGEISLNSLQAAAGITVAGPVEVIPAGPGKNQYHHEVFDYVRQHIGGEKEQDGVRSFNDLIWQFHEAVMADDRLAREVGQRYQAVFVDEFQDTDRAQFEILDRCFPKDGNTLFYLIGDPKQSIYEFRGADIHAYLEAKTTVARRFELTRNYRSTPAMIEAVNRIFGDGDLTEGHETPGVFLLDGLPYVSVVSGNADNRFPSMEKHALRLRHYVDSKDNAAQHIYRDVVREISWLLSDRCGMQVDEEKPDAGEGKKIVPRPLKASDIAILVPKHEQAAAFLQALNRAGIPASACKSGKIYSSPEAGIMLLFLHCLLHPEEQYIRGLLLSPFFRLSSEQLIRQDYDLEQIVGALTLMAAEWRTHGLPSAFLHFLDSPLAGTVPPRLCLLSEPDGERAVTNYLQLMELLYEKEIRGHLPPEDVLDFLNLAVNDQVDTDQTASTEGSDDNPDQLRLDRDSAAVQILTMFAAKGLEYPVVFVPFPARTAGSELIKYDIACKLRARDGSRILDFSRSDESKIYSFDEALRSQLRLLYVALTRASYVTYLYTQERPAGKKRMLNFVSSAQGVILTDPLAIPHNGTSYYRKCKENLPEPLTEWFRQLIQAGETEWGVFEKYPDRIGGNPRPDEGGTDRLTAGDPPFIRDHWRVMSFTTFKSQWDHSGEEDEKTERPEDRDSQDRREDLPPPVQDPTNFLNFPRGERAGTMVHELFEQLAGRFSDFAPDSPPERLAEIRVLIGQALKDSGYDPKTLGDALFDGIARALRTPLPEIGVPLCNIRNYIQETEFFLNAENSLDLHEILAVMKTLASEPVRSRITDEIAPFRKKGMINGLTDLIFEHDGRYYIVDWKTNYLGGSDSDYLPEQVLDAMVRERYILQAYLYSAALLRLLRRNGLPDERFGGVFYLFLRGMEPGKPNGIWHDVPPADCLNALLQLFQRGEKR